MMWKFVTSNGDVFYFISSFGVGKAVIISEAIPAKVHGVCFFVFGFGFFVFWFGFFLFVLLLVGIYFWDLGRNMGKAETNPLLALLQAEGACQDTDIC